jgi:hypothetical protein
MYIQRTKRRGENKGEGKRNRDQKRPTPRKQYEPTHHRDPRQTRERRKTGQTETEEGTREDPRTTKAQQPTRQAAGRGRGPWLAVGLRLAGPPPPACCLSCRLLGLCRARVFPGPFLCLCLPCLPPLPGLAGVAVVCWFILFAGGWPFLISVPLAFSLVLSPALCPLYIHARQLCFCASK